MFPPSLLSPLIEGTLASQVSESVVLGLDGDLGLDLLETGLLSPLSGCVQGAPPPDSQFLDQLLTGAFTSQSQGYFDAIFEGGYSEFLAGQM